MVIRNVMKIKYFNLSLLFLFANCSPWQDSTGDKIINETSLGLFLDDAASLERVKHNIDRGEVIFRINEDKKVIFSKLDNVGESYGWCISSTDETKVALIKSDKELDYSVEIITLKSYDGEKGIYGKIRYE